MKMLLMLSLAFFGLGQTNALDTKSILGVFYLKPMFVHLHQNSSRYSASLTTLACGHPVKVLQISKDNLPAEVVFNGSWNLVSAGPYEGYIRSEFLSPTRVDCFQDKYTKFFDLFELDLAELYYWGRLYDLYWQGKSKVR